MMRSISLKYTGAFWDTERLIHHAVTIEIESKESQVNYLGDMPILYLWKFSFDFGALLHVSAYLYLKFSFTNCL